MESKIHVHEFYGHHTRSHKKQKKSETAARRSAAAVHDQSVRIATQAQQVKVTHTNFEGPLPPPEYFRNYESICPGAAQAILDMAREEAAHRHQMEKNVLGLEADAISQEFGQRRLGLKMGFGVAIAGLILTGYLASIGAHWLAAVIGFSDLACLCGAFIYGSKQSGEGG